MKKLPLILIVLAILVGFYAYASSNSTPPQINVEPGEVTLVDESPVEESSSFSYVDYSQQALAAATANGNRAVLFFHAGWCPTCRVANDDLLDNGSQLPKDLTVLKVDYDNSDDLKAKYGITYQHTFVQVDSQGNELAKWNGGGVKELLANIK